uniref:thiamine-phosphate kinase n=1 Tax=Alistipes putredinis TaxID=28117 RepID=UPI003FD6F438
MTEFGLIDTIRDMFAAIPRNGFDGIGDDCTVFPLGSGESLVFTADLLAENIHFLRRATSARELGRKSLAVNLSDVAAMGARPIATLLSLAIPHDLPEGWIEDFMEGYRDLSAQYDVGLVGGDTTASDSGLVVNVTAIGRVADSHIKRRNDARPGDLIAVGGSLGESGAGLRDILAGRYDTPLAQIHRNPAPQVAEGIWLGERPEVHAMMDISDGIASDLRHILHRSGVGAEVDTECIPTPVDLETAVSGGEDYKLLFTVAPESADTLLSNYRLRFGNEFHFIGRITGGNHLEWLRNGTPLPVDWQGFRHY